MFFSRKTYKFKEGLNMKLLKLIEALQAIYAEYGDLEACYASDTEGNSFHLHYYEPTVGILKTCYEFDTETTTPTHVCIN